MSDATLAIDGGTPVRTAPYPAWPVFEDDEIAAVDAVLRSGRVNYHTGREGRTFEVELAAFTGARHAIALANGTVALELALRAFGIGPGDEVVVAPRTFVATATAVAVVGATPVFADIDPDTQGLSAETIAPVLTDRTRAVIVVHLGGMPCDMGPIMALADRADLHVIEDCAQALGTRYKGRHVGTIGHAGTLSFCQDKIMTTGGEGGALLIRDDDAYERAWSYKDHGKRRSLVYDERPRVGVAFRWLHESIGTNWRMTEMQSALGRVALAKVPAWVERRRENAAALADAFTDIPALRVPPPAHDVYHAYYRFYAFVRPEALAEGWTRDRVAEAVMAEGVPCMSGSCSEIYLEKAFTDAGFAPAKRLPVARELGERSLAFLVHHTAGPAEMADVTAAVSKVMKAASR
ncbi:MAG: DegT/DnrJ/EryC1/StrS aminotransferase family protein [Anaerosomatales bacterium]|nr:DegT/DnrJ/EryC1/StrS aminotransferase family protein [Anaerosomatales bacterium]